MSKTEVIHPDTTIGGRIQKMRHKAHLSRSALYDLVFPYGEAGSDANKETTVRNWEAGKYELDNQNMAAVCRELKCSSDYLLGLDECTNKTNQFIHDQTGLSEDAINKLLSFKGEDQCVIPLDFLLCSEDFKKILSSLFLLAQNRFELLYAELMSAEEDFMYKDNPALYAEFMSYNESPAFWRDFTDNLLEHSDTLELYLSKHLLHITDRILEAAPEIIPNASGSKAFRLNVEHYKRIFGSREDLWQQDIPDDDV